MLAKIPVNCRKVIENNKLIIAFSGGIDSVALTFLCRQLSSDLVLCYLDHQIRAKKETEKDINILKYTAERLELEYCIGHQDVPAYCQQNNLSLEDGARQLRYRFLSSIAEDKQAKYIATGHHQDDNSETILLKFIRGSGLRGLSGIQPISRYQEMHLVRPLLNYTKKELKLLVDKQKLKFNEDLTNRDEKIKRNLMRKKIIPQIKKINENFIETLNNVSTIYRDENNYLDNEAQKIMKKVTINSSRDQILIDARGLKLYDISLQRRVVRLAIEKLQGNLLDVSAVFIENFLNNNCNELYLNSSQKLEVRKKS